MKKIKIIVGTYGYLKDGKLPVLSIDKDSDPIVVADAEADRLIKLGVAVAVKDEAAVTEAAEEKPETETGHLDAKSLEDYTVPELRALAKDLGIKTNGTKDELIERISAVEVGVPSEEEAVVAEDEAEEPPVLEAADPE